MPDRYDEDWTEVPAHEKKRQQARADLEPCPHCSKAHAGQSHDSSCPVRRVEKRRRQDRLSVLRSLFKGLL
jgi:uncharacterized paraquat-inducible protein A